jgi:exopolyphosphatase/guanosine-5'-triphosphate,3'-diphosphate pyrophosphatase
MSTANTSLRPRRLAIIDVGTNSARLLVADVEPDGTWQAVTQERIACRLGADLAATGEISSLAEARTAAAIAVLLAAARTARADAVRVLATHALRSARNGDACRQRMQAHVGAPILLVSGEQEAAFALCVARRWTGQAASQLVALDLGGGSLELATELDGRVVAVSLPLGAVVLSAALPPGPIAVTALGPLRQRVGAELAGQARSFAGLGRTVAAAGGTATSAARLCGRRSPLSGAHVPASDIEAALARTAPLDVPARAALRGVGDRADIIVPGLVVLSTALEYLGADGCVVLEHGVREGALLAFAAGEL